MKKRQNIFVTFLELLKVKHTTAFSNQYFNEHPHKYNLFGLSKMLSKYGINALIIALPSCQMQNSDVPYIDVNKKYPEKEIILSDIAEISYIHLNSDDSDYLYDGSINVISENTLVVVDKSGTILFFSKDGMPKSRFNCLGNGPGEYRNVRNVLYDEASDDLFVIESRKIHVYSSAGRQKREIMLPQGTIINGIVSFDDHSLFFYDVSKEIKRTIANNADLTSEDWIAPFYCISKIDGTILDYLELINFSTYLGIYKNGIRLSTPTKRIVKCSEGVLLCNAGIDTVYLYGYEKSLTPVLFKTPPVTSLHPIEFLDNCYDIGNYQFIKIIIVQEGDIYPGIFPAKYFVRDKRTGEVFKQKFLLTDYKGKEVIISYDTGGIYEKGFWFELDLTELKTAYDDNKLSGQLKELVATLKDDDNDVIVLVNFK